MNFLEQYMKNTTIGEQDKLIKTTLSIKGADKLREALEIVKRYTGLDMKQEYLLTDLRCKLEMPRPEIFFKKGKTLKRREA